MRTTLRPSPAPARRAERGTSLIELMVALVVLSVGLLAVAQLFPLGSRNQTQDRLYTRAAAYAQEEIERLSGLAWTHPDLAEGTHPTVSLGNGFYQRSYTVAALASPLENIKKYTVTVTWANGAKTFVAMNYARR